MRTALMFLALLSLRCSPSGQQYSLTASLATADHTSF
jgi:hypothetical protein